MSVAMEPIKIETIKGIETYLVPRALEMLKNILNDGIKEKGIYYQLQFSNKTGEVEEEHIKKFADQFNELVSRELITGIYVSPSKLPLLNLDNVITKRFMIFFWVESKYTLEQLKQIMNY